MVILLIYTLCDRIQLLVATQHVQFDLELLISFLLRQVKRIYIHYVSTLTRHRFLDISSRFLGNMTLFLINDTISTIGTCEVDRELINVIIDKGPR